MVYNKDNVSISFMGETITGSNEGVLFKCLSKRAWYEIVEPKYGDPEGTRIRLVLDNSPYEASFVLKDGSEALKLILDSDPYNKNVSVTLNDGKLSINGGQL